MPRRRTLLLEGTREPLINAALRKNLNVRGARAAPIGACHLFSRQRGDEHEANNHSSNSICLHRHKTALVWRQGLPAHSLNRRKCVDRYLRVFSLVSRLLHITTFTVWSPVTVPLILIPWRCKSRTTDLPHRAINGCHGHDVGPERMSPRSRPTRPSMSFTLSQGL